MMKISKQSYTTLARTNSISSTSCSLQMKDNRKTALLQAKLIHKIQQAPKKEEDKKLENIDPSKIRPMQLKKFPASASGQPTAQLARVDIETGYPYQYAINAATLGTGTDTTAATRAAVNAGIIPPNQFNLMYAFYNTPTDTLADTNRRAQLPAVVTVPNPPIQGVNWDAGHALGKQNGGLGHIATHVFPQNRNINRGWAGTYGLWRFHEDIFNQGVARFGYGRWRIF